MLKEISILMVQVKILIIWKNENIKNNIKVKERIILNKKHFIKDFIQEIEAFLK